MRRAWQNTARTNSCSSIYGRDYSFECRAQCVTLISQTIISFPHTPCDGKKLESLISALAVSLWPLLPALRSLFFTDIRLILDLVQFGPSILPCLSLNCVRLSIGWLTNYKSMHKRLLFTQLQPFSSARLFVRSSASEFGSAFLRRPHVSCIKVKFVVCHQRVLNSFLRLTLCCK